MPATDTPFIVPDPSIVVLVGPAGCGKSTVARRHFRRQDIISSDRCRELVAGDAGDQSATPDAFALLRSIVDRRAKRRRLTVVDATNVTRRERERFVTVARRHDLPCVALVFALPVEACQNWAMARFERPVGPEVVARQHASLHRSLDGMDDEGFDRIHVIDTFDALAGLTVAFDPAAASTSTSDAERGSALPPAVVVDLDGTITSAAWRAPLLAVPRRKRAAAFFEAMHRDAPVEPVIELVRWVAHHADVVLLTGRPADYEPAIRTWLADHEVPYDRLLMRSPGDRRQDTEVKREYYRQEIAPRYDVRIVIDDRPRVIEMWREEGCYVLTAVDPRLDPLDRSSPRSAPLDGPPSDGPPQAQATADR